MSRKRNPIVMAMGNLLGMPWAHFMPVEVFVFIARRAGYDGIQYQPIRLAASIQVLLGFLSPYAKRHIYAMEQSYRSERSWSEVRRHSYWKLAAFSYFVMPERRYSMRHLQRLQYKLDSPTIPVVIYPYHAGMIGDEYWGEGQYPQFFSFAKRLFQPESGLVSRWNIQSLEDFVAKVKEEGFTGVCLDTFHLRRGNTLGNWREMLEAFLPITRLIHLRVKSSAEKFESGVDSFGELVDVLDRTYARNLAQMIAEIIRFGYEGPIVLEIPLDISARIAGWQVFVSPWRFIKAQRTVVDAVCELIECVE